MLDMWIIEEILRRQQLRREERPLLELPLWAPEDQEIREVRDEEQQRGVVVVDYGLK